MRAEMVKRLLDINREFYQSFAVPFRAKRDRLQPGALRVLDSLPMDAHLLDLGCAHGAFAKALSEEGFSGRYVGLEASRPLLDQAPQELGSPRYSFKLADLSDPKWPELARTTLLGVSAAVSRPKQEARFDWILAFAVLHHLPADSLRRETLAAIRSLLNPSGGVAVSVWDFLASARLQERVVPWDSVGLTEADVDSGDYLVEWREGGTGMRYVHHFDDGELSDLAEGAGFEVREKFRSDGEAQRLGRYQIWAQAPQS